jgi:hypothetical protein
VFRILASSLRFYSNVAKPRRQQQATAGMRKWQEVQRNAPKKNELKKRISPNTLMVLRTFFSRWISGFIRCDSLRFPLPYLFHEVEASYYVHFAIAKRIFIHSTSPRFPFPAEASFACFLSTINLSVRKRSAEWKSEKKAATLEEEKYERSLVVTDDELSRVKSGSQGEVRYQCNHLKFIRLVCSLLFVSSSQRECGGGFMLFNQAPSICASAFSEMEERVKPFALHGTALHFIIKIELHYSRSKRGRRRSRNNNKR